MINNQLLEYIRQQKQQGVSDKDIKAVLTVQGWQSQVLDEAFYLVSNQAATIASVPVSPPSNVPPASAPSVSTPQVKPKASIFVIIVVILNIVIALYFFLLANFLLWASILVIFVGTFAKQELLKNPLAFIINVLLAPFLIGAAIVFFRKSVNKYKYGLAILVFILLETQIYRFFFVTNNRLEWTDFSNLLFYGIPAGVIYLTKYLDQKYVSRN